MASHTDELATANVDRSIQLATHSGNFHQTVTGGFDTTNADDRIMNLNEESSLLDPEY